MIESEFRDYLRCLRKPDGKLRFQETTIRNRVSNCKNVERHEGDLDQHFDKDRCSDLLQRLSYSIVDHDTNNPPNHKVPIDGDLRNGSATLKSAVKLYAEFRQRRTSPPDSLDVATGAGPHPVKRLDLLFLGMVKIVLIL